MVQRLRHQRRRDFARRDPIWREQPSYRRILFQGFGQGASRRRRDRSARRGRGAVHQGSARRLISCPRRSVTMPVYTVHAPVGSNADLATTDKISFVRDGFHFWAVVFSVIWLAWHRLWLALLGRGTILMVDVVLALLLGFEAASLKRWTLSRRKWRQFDIVVADDEETAER